MKTKELAAMFHLSENTIRNYHTSGFLNPVVNTGKERKFTLEDFKVLQEITRYKDLGISIKDIAEILENGNYETIRKMLEKACTSLHEELQEKQIRAQYLDYVVDNLNVDRYLVNRISFEYAPCIRYYDAGNAEKFRKANYIFNHADVLKEWSKYAGCVNDLELYKTEDILKGDISSYHVCISMLDTFAQNTANEMIQKADMLPECTCLITVVIVKEDPEELLRAMQGLLQYAEREHIKLKDNMPLVKKRILSGKREQYYKLYLPIE